MAERRKRATDPEMDDHTDERVTDWKTVAPRWVLVTALFVSMGANGLLGSMLSNSVTARLEQIERAYADPKWDALSNLAQRQGELEAVVKQHESRIDRLEETDTRAQLLRLTMQVERLNEQFKRKGF